ncbi:GNAT family N-acetyltransferase [Halorussus marinus]|uniref:GNAT family N-acetyltransferase n=1 Tax=Halorussus marinus TaxID=2505976 RepID=UPI0010920283|nr:GNAT family protein [Halorussus marinus]
MPGPVFLEADAVTLRPVEAADVEFVQRCMNDPRVWRPALDATPMNREQGTEFFEDVLSDEDHVHCLIWDDDAPVGVVSLTGTEYGPGATDRSRAAEIGYYVAPEHHGNGYGSDAVAELVRYAFEDLNLRRASARVGAFNDASIGLLESLGFEREGRLREAAWFRGEYRDMLWYGLLRADWRAE